MIDHFTGADRRLSFVVDRATFHDFGQGPVERTGNPLDLALDGNAFFVVQANGNERYTRNGAFQINAQGQLVTNDGHQVIGTTGPITFQPNDQDISIARDGTITVREGNNTNVDSVRGKLRLASFEQPQTALRSWARTCSQRQTASSHRTPSIRACARARSRNRTSAASPRWRR